MRGSIAIVSLCVTGNAAAQATAIPAGTYSNEEQVYFEKEAGRTPPPWLSLVVDVGGSIRAVDAMGTPAPLPKLTTTMDGDVLRAATPRGRPFELRRARPVTCWASLKKDAPKPDGKEDWTFDKDLKLHDQGGRVAVRVGEAGVKPVILRIRNVTWSGSARSTNRPSLVLYVHTPDDPDRAISYVWADPGAARLGVNLRWMQASCTVDGLEKTTTN